MARRDVAAVIVPFFWFSWPPSSRAFPAVEWARQKALAPLCQLFGLAVLLVPGKGQLHTADRAGAWKKSLIGIFLVLFPCCILPAIGFDDPGGMVGGLALLLPFLFVVVLGDHRPLAKWTAGALIALAVAGISIFFPAWAIHWPRVFTRVTIAEHTSKWAQDQWLAQPSLRQKRRFAGTAVCVRR